MSETPTLYPHQESDTVTPDDLAKHMSEHPEMYHPDLIEHVNRVTGLASSAGSLAAEAVTDKSDLTEPGIERLEDLRREDLEQLLKIAEFFRREVDKDYQRRDYAVEEVKNYLGLSPEELRAMRENSYYQYKGYASLLADIREIRKGQSEYVRHRMSELPEGVSDEERRATFIDALSYSPVLGARALSLIKKHEGFYSTKPLMTAEEAAQKSESKEVFNETLNQILITQPDVVVDQYRLLKLFVEPKVLQDCLYRTLQISPSSLEFAEIKYILNNVFESQEEKKVFMAAAMSSIDNLRMRIIWDKDLQSIYDADEIKAMIGDELKRGNTGMMDDRLFENGVVDEEQLLQLLDTRDSRFGEWGNDIDKFIYAAGGNRYGTESKLPESVVTKGKAKLAELLESKSLSSHDSFRIINLDIFTEEERHNAVRNLYNVHPIDTLRELFSTNKAQQYFSSEELPAMARDLINTENAESYGFGDVIVGIASLGILTNEELRSAIGLLSGYHFMNLAPKLSGIGLYGEEEINGMVIDAYGSMTPNLRSTHIDEIEKYMTAEELQAEIRNIFESGGHISYYTLGKDNIKAKLGDLDIDALYNGLVDKIVRDNQSDLHSISFILDNISSNQGLEAARAAALKFSTWKPEDILRVIDGSDSLFPPEMILETVQKLTESDSGKAKLIESLTGYKNGSYWTRYVDADMIRNIILSAPSSSLVSLILNRKNLLSYISQSEADTITSRFVDDNPAQALWTLSASRNTEELGYDDAAVAESVSRSRGVPGVDKQLQSLVARAMTISREGTKKILLREASITYSALSILQKEGLIEKANSIIENEGITGQRCLDLVESIAVLSVLSNESKEFNLESSKDVSASLSKYLFTIAGREVGGDLDPSSIETHKDEIRTLAAYIIRHRNSQEHVSLTGEMLSSVLSGNYRNWKFGDGSPESLEAMKQQGLYPAGLTAQQLAEWSKDTSTQVSDSFTVEADAAAQSLVSIIRENEQFFDGAMEETQSVKNEISEIGKLIAEVEKEKQLLKNAKDTSLAESQMEELQEKAASLRSSLARLQLVDDLQSLLNLDAEQIQSGALMQADGKKGRNLDVVLQRLRKNAPKGAEEVLDRVELALDSFRSQTGEVVNMVVSDDSELLTTLRVGVEPVGSCQNFRTGELNQALYGYTDANTKVLMLRNEKGSPIGRAIFRLLSDENGNPALHVDTIYSTDISDGARRAVYAHAIKKAEAMGIPIYVSELSQNEEGIKQSIRPIPGLKLEATEGAKLKSSASRAPFVYADAGGGIMPNGVYNLAGLKRISVE